MQTYLNSPELKAAFLAEIAKHEEMDAFIKGTYGEVVGPNFRGCAIGCSLHSLNIINGAADMELTARTGDHARYEKELGLPIWLAYLEDHLFETLPIEEAKTWPRRFAEAIPVGVVVHDIVLAKILRWTLADPEFGVRYATDDDEIRGYIDGVVAGFDAEISSGGLATAEQREAAARDVWAAWAARDRAARAARDVWAARAARDAWAAWAARDARDRAARAARDAWDAWVARDAWDAWVARDAEHNGAKAALFSTALARYVIEVLRELQPVETAA